MKYKNYSILAAMIVAVMGVSVVSLSSMDSQTDVSITTPEPKSLPLDNYGQTKSLDVAQRDEAFSIASAKTPIDKLPLQSVKTKDGSTSLFYGPAVKEDSTRKSYLADGGLIILNKESTSDKNKETLNDLVNESGIKAITVQGHPTFGFELDGESQLRIFPVDGDRKITLMYNGSLENLLELAEKINLS